MQKKTKQKKHTHTQKQYSKQANQQKDHKKSNAASNN